MNTIRLIYLPIILLAVACNSKDISPKKPDQSANAIANVSQAKATVYDTTYCIGSVLICAAKGMKLDIISKKYPEKALISKGDTLYNDEDTLILGDLKDMAKKPASANILMGDSLALEGVYKRYNQKFNFSMFKINDIYRGKLALPDFQTDPSAKYYKAMINQENNGINFAGHYNIVELSKQGSSQLLAVVDKINGKVYHKFPFGAFGYYLGISFNKNSRMLIISSDLLDLFPGYSLIRDNSNDYHKLQPEIYLWNDSLFKRIQ